MFGFGKRSKHPEGIALLKAGRLEDALVYFAAQIQKEPNDIDAIIQISKIHFRKKDYAQTRECLKKIIGKDLDDYHAQQVLDITNYRKLSSDKYLNSYPVFSPDGEWIAFTSARRDTSGDGKIRVDDRPGLYMVNVSTRQEMMIAPDDYYNSQPAFSPDGQRVLFLSAREDTNMDGKIDQTDSPALYVKDLSTGREECLIESMHRPKFPSFSPDGNSVLFCAWYAKARVCGIYLLDMNTKKIKVVHSVFETNFPIFSPKGNKIIFSSWRKDTNKDGVVDLRDNSALYEINLHSGAETQLAGDDYSNSYPNYSPDGESIVFLSRRRDTNNDGQINSLDNSGIYVLNIAKRKEKEIVSDEHYNKFATFSFDGRRVVYLGSWHTKAKKMDEDDLEHSEYFDNKGIHSVDSGGGDEQEIMTTKYYGSRFLCTSPAGNLVAYISWRKDTNRALYVAPFGRQLTKDEIKDIIENNL